MEEQPRVNLTALIAFVGGDLVKGADGKLRARLTPDQTRELGRLLVGAADQIDDFEITPEMIQEQIERLRKLGSD